MPEGASDKLDVWGLDALLKAHTGLSIRPHSTGGLRLAGELAFRSQVDGYEELTDCYNVEIRVPGMFPRLAPAVFEQGGRIPKDFHTEDTGTLCLGSPVRLLKILKSDPTLLGFVDNCVVPFLYNHSYLDRYEKLPLGELDHGNAGIIQDYMSLFGINDAKACREMLKLLCMKKRVANKHRCPCGSGKRLGRCHNLLLNTFREIGSRSWFRRHHMGLFEQEPR